MFLPQYYLEEWETNSYAKIAMKVIENTFFILSNFKKLLSLLTPNSRNYCAAGECSVYCCHVMATKKENKTIPPRRNEGHSSLRCDKVFIVQ